MGRPGRSFFPQTGDVSSFRTGTCVDLTKRRCLTASDGYTQSKRADRQAAIPNQFELTAASAGWRPAYAGRSGHGPASQPLGWPWRLLGSEAEKTPLNRSKRNKQRPRKWSIRRQVPRRDRSPHRGLDPRIAIGLMTAVLCFVSFLRFYSHPLAVAEVVCLRAVKCSAGSMLVANSGMQPAFSAQITGVFRCFGLLQSGERPRFRGQREAGKYGEKNVQIFFRNC
jgi:hypothetical protein